MKRTVILHPFLFAVYAIVGVYSNNADEVPVQWVFRPMVILLILIAIIFFLLQRKLTDSQHAGLITTLVLFWLFFGHIHRSLVEKSVFWNTLWGTSIALAAWTIPLMWIGSKWAWKKITNRTFITSFLNTTSIIVVLLPVYITGKSLVQTIWWVGVHKNQRAMISPIALRRESSPPDIYLIILDAYGREDFLREVYRFDNHEFTESLRSKGFYVADQSSPNYPMTWLSLSSLLNFDYLDDFTRELRNTQAHGPGYDLLQNSDVRRLFHDAGYQFIALPSATLFTQMRDADIYYKMTSSDLNEFEGLVLSSTVANLVVNAWNLDLPVPSYDLHRQYILFSLEKLETVATIKGPKFVFAHIMAPHPPFVLDEFGNYVQSTLPYNMGDASGFMGTSEEYVTGYVNEIRFLNRRLIEVIDMILEQSEQPPVIIIQGDHGPGNYFNLREPNNICLKERYSILNAYYFPDGNYAALYPAITPVNSFRVVLNQYFESQLELLEDRNYYATWSAPYVFNDITEQSQSCQLVPEE
jgi:hypothetical protein